MQVGLFGRIGDLLGREVEVDAAGASTVGGLRRRLADLFPVAATDFTGGALKVAIADRLVDDDHPLAGVERVEFLPPLSGG